VVLVTKEGSLGPRGVEGLNPGGVAWRQVLPSEELWPAEQYGAFAVEAFVKNVLGDQD
jgi:hypothetical protein